MDETSQGFSELVDDADSANLINKFLTKIQFLKSNPFNNKSVNIILCGLNNLSRLMSYKYDTAKNLSIKWMETILEIIEKCDNATAKADFEKMIPSLTCYCATIVGYSTYPRYQSKFFLLWKDILVKTSVEIRRKAFIENRNITQIFESIFRIGHYLTQVNGLKVLFMYIITSDNDRKLLLYKIMSSPKCKSMRRIIANFNNQNFDIIARQFLNEFNMNVSEEQPVFSIKVKAGYIGTTPIKNPEYQGTQLSLWIDFNSSTASISFYCNEATFPEGNSKNSVTVEAYIKNILIDRNIQELRVYSKKSIEVNPPRDYKIFNQYKNEFRFSYNKADTERILHIVSFYNLGGNKKIDTSSKYWGYKTLIHTETGIDKKSQKPVNIRNPPNADDDKCSKVSTNLSATSKNTFQKHLASQLILEKCSDIVSSKTSKYPLDSVEIDETCTEISDTNSNLKTQNNRGLKRKQAPPVNEIQTLPRHTQAMLNSTEKSGEHSNFDGCTFEIVSNNHTNDNDSPNLSSNNTTVISINNIEKMKQKTVEVNDLKTLSLQKEVILNNTEKSSKKTNSGSCISDRRTNKKTVGNISLNQTLIRSKELSYNNIQKGSSVLSTPESERILNIVEKINYNLNMDTKQDDLFDFLKHTVSFNENKDDGKVTASTSKRKLYSANEDLPCSQISKDSQIQRRNYIKEKRKYLSKDKLNLVNLLDPFEISGQSEQVLEITSSTNDKIIAGDNEEIIRKNMEEFVDNHGYVGIKNALQDENKVSHITPKQREVLNKNIEKINLMCERSVKKFFKNDDRDLSKSRIYDISNVVIDNSKRPRRRATKTAKTVQNKPIPPISREKNNLTKIIEPSKNKNNILNIKPSIDVVQSDRNEITFPSISNASDMDISTAKGDEELVEQMPVTTSSPKPQIFNSETSSKNQNTHTNIGEEESENNCIPDINILRIEKTNININQPFNKTDSDAAEGQTNLIFDERNHEPNCDDVDKRITSPFAQSILTAANISIMEAVNSTLSESSVSVQNSNTIVHRNNPSEVSLPRLLVFEVEPNNTFVEKDQSQITNEYRRRPTKQTYRKSKGDKRSTNVPETIASGDDDCSSTASSWILQKYLSNISKTSPEHAEGNVTEIEPCRAQLVENIEEIRSLNSKLNLELFEDDNVDLESYESESTNIGAHSNERTSESDDDSAIYNVSKILKAPQFHDKKRMSTECAEIIPLKKYKDTVNQTVEDEMISSFESIANDIFARISKSLEDKGSNQNILELIENIFKSYLEPYLNHAQNSKRSFKKLKIIRNTLKKEKSIFLMESSSANKQLRKLCAALGTVEKSCKEKEVNMNQAYDSAVAAMNNQLENAMKTHWEKYIEKVTKAYISVIQQHSVIDTSYED